MTVRIAALALASLAVVLVGCHSAPSTPLPPETVAVIAGRPISHDEFLTAREQVVRNVRKMKQDIEPESELMRISGGEFREFTLRRIEAIEHHGPDAIALAVFIRDEALWVAAVAGGHEVSDEEVADHVAEQRAGVASAIESARREVESGQSEDGGLTVPSPEETLSNYAQAVALAGGEEALWEEAKIFWKRSLSIGRFINAEVDRYTDAEFDRAYREEVVFYDEARLRAERAAVAEAEVVITGDPPIDATREEALAYLEWFWEETSATPSR